MAVSSRASKRSPLPLALSALPAWSETSCFSTWSRSALLLAEAFTRVAESRVSDTDYDSASAVAKQQAPV